MNIANFIDLDALVKMESQVWIVNKANANQPIIKISQSDFNLIKNGIFKKLGNKVDFMGKTYYLSNELMNQIKVKSKVLDINMGDLAISLQEFLNKDIISEKNFEIRDDVLELLKNKTDDIYIVCSKQVKRSHEKLIEKINEEFTKRGLSIKNYYFISENFMNQNNDEILFKKIRLLIQHLVGYKTDEKKFSDEEITRYDKIHYWDKSLDTMRIKSEINNTLEFLVAKTEPGLQDVIKEDVIDNKPQIFIHRVNDNNMSKETQEKVILNISKIIKQFENFNPYS